MSDAANLAGKYSSLVDRLRKADGISKRSKSYALLCEAANGVVELASELREARKDAIHYMEERDEARGYAEFFRGDGHGGDYLLPWETSATGESAEETDWRGRG